MNPIQLFDAPSSAYTYLLFDSVSRDAVIVDPVDSQLSGTRRCWLSMG